MSPLHQKPFSNQNPLYEAQKHVPTIYINSFELHQILWICRIWSTRHRWRMIMHMWAWTHVIFQLHPLHNAQRHETPKIHLYVVLFSWFGALDSFTFVSCGMSHTVIICRTLKNMKNAWLNLCNLNLTSFKEKLFAFVRLVSLFTTKVFRNVGLKTMEGQMVPPMHNWIFLGHNHINFCLASFMFTYLKWPLKHGTRIFQPILLTHFTCVELWIAKQATCDLGPILAMCQSMGKILVSIT